MNSVQDLIIQLAPVKDGLIAKAYILISLTFAISAASFQYFLHQGNKQLFSSIVKLLVFVSLLAIYPSIFIGSETVCTNMAQSIFPESSFYEYMQTISQGLQSAQNKEMSIWSALQGGISSLIVTVSYIVALLAYKILSILKLMLLGLLYVLGPFILALSVLPDSGDMTLSWLKNIISVSAWPIVANLLLLLQQKIGLAAMHSDPENFIPLLAANVTFTLSLLSTPALVSMLMNGFSTVSASGNIANRMFQNTMLPASFALMASRAKKSLSVNAAALKDKKTLQRKGIRS